LATTRSRPVIWTRLPCKEGQSRKKPQRRRDEEYGVWNIRHYGLYNLSLYIGKRHDGKEVYGELARVGR
jgi:hypothetical protein